MEWLLWLVGVPVMCVLLLWAASKFTFPRKPAGGSASSGIFDALNDVYSPSSTAARIERDEQKRRVIESAQGQDRDPLAGFHPRDPQASAAAPETRPADAPEDGPDT
ncbi:hypothetical protein ACSYDW_14420 [Paeniglutamicibacter sp. R2-26]|uniref:hypothetical protein n=1 Tax=Paeniglutamicibacter sp. R2-26 TaxID=3144417 RepID=UPI003EE63A5A